MAFPIEPPVAPMLARVQDEIPVGEGWLYEPKWDGFRAIVYRDRGELHIGSRNGQPLERYFPELIEVFARALPQRCVVDGEIVVPANGRLDFDMLSQRIHPAASRVRMLAREIPASFVAFDLLANGRGDVRARRLDERRRLLAEAVAAEPSCFLTPQTADPAEAARWFDRFEGAGLDGVIAKRADLPYVPGERVMVKVKHARTADCVVGGYRVHKSGNGVGSLLLGLYDEDGVLHHVGFTSSFKPAQRLEILAKLRPLEGGTSFGDGRTPGGPSRWSAGKDLSWVAVEPKLVCEVAFDYLQGIRFRHGTRFLRWRPDKDPSSCTFEQFEPPRPVSLKEIMALARR